MGRSNVPSQIRAPGKTSATLFTLYLGTLGTCRGEGRGCWAYTVKHLHVVLQVLETHEGDRTENDRDYLQHTK